MAGRAGPKMSKTAASRSMGSLSGTKVKGKTGNLKETALPKGGCQSNRKGGAKY